MSESVHVVVDFGNVDRKGEATCSVSGGFGRVGWLFCGFGVVAKTDRASAGGGQVWGVIKFRLAVGVVLRGVSLVAFHGGGIRGLAESACLEQGGYGGTRVGCGAAGGCFGHIEAT